MTIQWIQIFPSEAAAIAALTPGVPRRVIIGNIRICLSRLPTGYYAVQDACSHNGESLSRGKINHLGEIVCPWHGYRFSLQSGRACDSSSPDL